MQKKNALLTAAAFALLAAAPTTWAQNQGKLKVGFMLPATGTFAALGTAIDNGFRLYVAEQGGKIAGREVEFVAIDEIQLCADPERGHVFTARLMHARGLLETMFLGADTIKPLMRRLVPRAEYISAAKWPVATALSAYFTSNGLSLFWPPPCWRTISGRRACTALRLSVGPRWPRTCARPVMPGLMQ